MAKTVLLECDKCGSTKDVANLSSTRSDGKHLDLDLCSKCWAVLVKDYGARLTDRQPRRTFEVVDESDIK